MDNYTVHVDYDNSISLKEFGEIIEIIRLSFNDANRNMGKNNNNISKYAPAINYVEKGSIILNIIVNLAVGVTVNLISAAIKSRINNSKNLNNVNVTITEEKIIEIKYNVEDERKS